MHTLQEKSTDERLIRSEAACLFSVSLSDVKRYIIMRPLPPLPMTPQRVSLWGVESYGKALEAAYGVVQVPLRLAVEFDAPYVACEHSEHRLALYASHVLTHTSVDAEPEGQVS